MVVLVAFFFAGVFLNFGVPFLISLRNGKPTLGAFLVIFACGRPWGSCKITLAFRCRPLCFQYYRWMALWKPISRDQYLYQRDCWGYYSAQEQLVLDTLEYLSRVQLEAKVEQRESLASSPLSSATLSSITTGALG